MTRFTADRINGDEAFQSVVRRMVSLVDRAGDEATHGQRFRAREHFTTTSRYVWML
ncbi:hypothetical protein [Planotetraspora mira]|uniref:hypothetical protein n=1 Tax=Planotetraspora mira TaxID=58121 RepID=UPI003670A926